MEFKKNIDVDHKDGDNVEVQPYWGTVIVNIQLSNYGRRPIFYTIHLGGIC